VPNPLRSEIISYKGFYSVSSFYKPKTSKSLLKNVSFAHLCFSLWLCICMVMYVHGHICTLSSTFMVMYVHGHKSHSHTFQKT